MLIRRSVPLVLLLALSASLIVFMIGKPRAAIVLTVSAAVGILTAICLEAALVRILQPGRPRLTRSALLLVLAHLAIWGVFLVALYRTRQSVELWAVAAGLGFFLLGLSLGGVRGRGGSPREG